MQFNYVQIGSKNYKKLAQFYKDVLLFEEVKENDWLGDKEGVVLKAPGFENDMPMYFGFIKANKGNNAAINDKGYAHTCYETSDVKAMVSLLVKHGGSFQSTLKFPKINPCVYCKDPDGNVVEFHIPFPSVDTKVGKTVLSLLGLKHDNFIRHNKGKTNLRFIHVNMISDDWRSLCNFYNDTFGSKDFGNLKDHSGGYKEKVIGIKGVHVIGQHVLLPNLYNSYPTFEVFSYSIKGRNNPCKDNEIGINAIGFRSLDFKNDIKLIEDNGGKLIEKNKDYVIMNDPQGATIYLRK